MRSQDENTNVTKGKASPSLTLISGKGERHYTISKEETKVGRSPECDIVINDSSISREHARIVYLAGTFFIYDNESLNGTLVNGKKISESKIESGDTIKIGDSEFKFEFGPSRKEEPVKQLLKEPKSRQKSITPKNEEGKRFKIYALAAVLLLILFLSMFALKKLKSPSREIESTDSAVSTPDYDIPMDTKALGTVDTNEAARYYDLGIMAMMSQNLNSAISYFGQALQKQPLHAGAAKKLKQCRELLKTKIEETYDAGIREFNIMQYDRAILEWNKVILMAKDFDEGMAKKAKEKIIEAEKIKAKLSNR